MDFSALSPETLTQWYRFALLLKGRSDAAETLLLQTCTELAPRIEEIRTEKSQRAFFVRQLRERSLTSGETDLNGSDAPPVARAVAAMPEPMRSAVALFFLKIFPVAEIASILGVPIEELGDLLAAGRTRLTEAGVAVEPSAP